MITDSSRTRPNPPPTRTRAAGAGRISLQSAAAVLLILVVVATLYLFFGPMPDDGAAGAADADGLAAAHARHHRHGRTGGHGRRDRRRRVDGRHPEPGHAGRRRDGLLAQPTSATPSLLGASVGTPLPGGALGVGAFVTVTGVGSDGLRYRMGAGADYLTIRIVAEGETLKVLGGPETEGGTVFWRVQDALGNVGWAAEPFLAPGAAPPAWNPPLASPTFEADILGQPAGAPGGTTP
ncbi:MAG: hypothetical protein U0470_08700 [Anaerolineae bacterium]